MDNSSNIVSPEVYQDKLLGAIQGCILGDSLGAPHEFWYNKNLKFTGKLEHRPRMLSQFQGTRYGVIGQWTDDSEMTLALLSSLALSKGSYDSDETVKMYMKWANSKPIGMGRNTRKLFYGIKTLRGYKKRWNKYFGPDVVREYEPESNGSLMRASPLAVLQDTQGCIQDCNLSNPTSLNQEANRIYVSSIRLALQGASKKTILAQAKKTKNKRIRIILAHALHPNGRSRKYPPKEGEIQPFDINGKMKGWVGISLYVAFRLFAFTNSFKEAVQKAVSWGGDTDTNAAITGALCGAYYGSKKILSDFTTHKNWTVISNAKTEEESFPRPSQYTPYDLESLISEIIKYYPLPNKDF